LTIAATKALAPECDVWCLARHPFQGEAAKNCGATDVTYESKSLYRQIADASGAKYHKGQFGNEILLGGFDIVYDTIGNEQSLHNALRWAKGGGRVVLMGIHFHPGKLDYSPIWNQEVEVVGINCHATEQAGQTSFDMAAGLLADPKFPAGGLITHRFPMDRYKEAIRTFLSKSSSGAIKIVLEHGQ